MSIEQIMPKINYKNAEPIFNVLNEIGCPYAVVKGEALSKMAYGAFGMRHLGDIDILLDKSCIDRVNSIMLKAGFNQALASRADKILALTQSHQTIPYTKHSATVDVNFDIAWGEYEGTPIDINDFLSDTVPLEIYGVNVKVLTPIKSFIQLAMHHYKDMNSIFMLATRKSIRYDMFKDIYFLLKNNPDITPKELYSLSEKYNIKPYIYYILYYTSLIYDDNFLKEFVSALKNSAGEALLNCYGLCAKERKQWKADFETRIKSDNLYELIENDLTENDIEKIAVNTRIFLAHK